MVGLVAWSNRPFWAERCGARGRRMVSVGVGSLDPETASQALRFKGLERRNAVRLSDIVLEPVPTSRTTRGNGFISWATTGGSCSELFEVTIRELAVCRQIHYAGRVGIQENWNCHIRQQAWAIDCSFDLVWSGKAPLVEA